MLEDFNVEKPKHIENVFTRTFGKKYPPEIKAAALKEFLTTNNSIHDIVKKYGLTNNAVLYYWKAKAEKVGEFKLPEEEFKKPMMDDIPNKVEFIPHETCENNGISDLRKKRKGASGPRHSIDFKKKAVYDYIVNEMPVKEIIEKYNLQTGKTISEKTIYYWIRTPRFKPKRKIEIPVQQDIMQVTPIQVTPVQQEPTTKHINNEDLYAIIGKLYVENNLLKKEIK